MKDEVLISRDSAELLHDGVSYKRKSGRVYVIAVGFASGIFSSTNDPESATRFNRNEAEKMIAEGRWFGNAPMIEEFPSKS